MNIIIIDFGLHGPEPKRSCRILNAAQIRAPQKLKKENDIYFSDLLKMKQNYMSTILPHCHSTYHRACHPENTPVQLGGMNPKN